MLERNARLLEGVARDAPLIEIGPSFNPIAPKAEGWQVTIVDHASQAELVAKYAGGAVETDRIEPVDVVWAGGPLHEAVPVARQGRYAALIASHVVEHLPDLIGFLGSAEKLLDPAGGALLLAVPDMRLCFDFFRPHSTTGQILAAQHERRVRHSNSALFDHVAYMTINGGRGGWGREPLRELRLEHGLELAIEHFESAAIETAYRDCHAWQFTPASFELLMLELGALGKIDWQIEWLDPQPAIEFLVRLRRGRQYFASPEAREARRLELMKRMILEMREQSDRLLAEPPALQALPSAESQLGAIESRLRQISEAQLPAIAASLGEAREDLRPMRSALDTLLPVRRAIARLRGRG